METIKISNKEDVSEPVARVYWTREEKDILKWVDLCVRRHVRFYMSAHKEDNTSMGPVIYSFRLEPIPKDLDIKFLENNGFEHGFLVYKRKEKFTKRDLLKEVRKSEL